MKAKDKIYKALTEDLDIKHPDVWKGEALDGTNIWQFREFNTSNARYLGKSLAESLEIIKEWVYLQSELY